MKTQCVEISNQCNQQAASLVSKATFMRKVQNFIAMKQHLEDAMDWSIHADLMLCAACYSTDEVVS